MLATLLAELADRKHLMDKVIIAGKYKTKQGGSGYIYATCSLSKNTHQSAAGRWAGYIILRDHHPIATPAPKTENGRPPENFTRPSASFKTDRCPATTTSPCSAREDRQYLSCCHNKTANDSHHVGTEMVVASQRPLSSLTSHPILGISTKSHAPAVQAVTSTY